MLNDEIKQYLAKVCQILNLHGVDYLVTDGEALSPLSVHMKRTLKEYSSSCRR